MRLLASTQKVIAKDKNSENVPKLEIVDIILMHRNCNVVLFTFVTDKQFGQLINISPHS